MGLVDIGPDSRQLGSRVVVVAERFTAHTLGDDTPDPGVLRG